MGYENTRPKMSREERAKQFLPFSAVRGLEEALERKRQELFVESKRILCNDAEEEIDEVLRDLKKGDFVLIEYFSGEKNKTKKGRINDLRCEKSLLVVDGEVIEFSQIGRLIILEKEKEKES